MSFRVALAIDVNGAFLAHFGRASHFAVYEFSSGRASLLDTRATEIFCQQLDKQQRLESVADLLADCNAVVAAAIGPCARQELKEANVQTLEFDGCVEDAIRTIAQYPHLN
ncbi:MAG: NifB/NifX family molybdenum-iron cluster-binding protein [Terracidiphilus sp.]